ncbi:hypothetical protein [Glycocaulis sp.]
MLGIAIDIFHWIAGAVLALVGISYDRVDDCAPPVRQQIIEEAHVFTGEGMLHQASGSFEWTYSVLEDGSVRVNIQPVNVHEVSGCDAPVMRLPEAPRAPVLRL